MLLRLKIKNFLSFNEETVFDMFPNPKRASFPNHIYSDKKIPLLKQAAIYGANGAGKSNFVKALIFLRNFIIDEDFLKNITLDDYYFQLTDRVQKTISFEVEFYTHGRYLVYSVDIDETTISESLLVSGLGTVTDQPVFKRIGKKLIAKTVQNVDSATKLLEMNTHSSLLPLNQKFPVLPNDEVRDAYAWFLEKMVIVTVNSSVPALIHMMSKWPDMMAFTNDVFSKTGVGIQSFRVSNQPLDEWMTHHQRYRDIQHLIEQDPLRPDTAISRIDNNRNIFAVTMVNGMKMAQELIFEQIGQLGFKKEMKISAQSEGTVRLLNLIPVMYDAIRHEKVVIVDEIDNSMHPKLLFSLIQFFSATETKGQLIYTTHSSILINQQTLLRPDEIWLVEKEQGCSSLYSINDFKIHNTINLENGYLDGRYGGVPQLEEM